MGFTLVWHSTMSFSKKTRNDLIFTSKIVDVEQLVDMSRFLSSKWFIGRHLEHGCSHYE